MLLSVQASNSYAYRDGLDFSMVRTNAAIREFKANHDEEQIEWNPEVSSVSAIFGANASGKTGFIRSIHDLIRNVREGGFEDISVSRFLLDKESLDRPTSFEIRFVARSLEDDQGLSEYVYGYSVLDGIVQKEELEARELRSALRMRRIFQRTLSKHEGGGQYTYRFGQSFRGRKALIKSITKPDRLFLAASGTLDENPLQLVLNWFQTGIRFYSASGYAQEIPRVVERLKTDDGVFREKVARFLVAADLGLSGVEVRRLTSEQYAELERIFADAPEGFDAESMLESMAWSLYFSHTTENGRVSLGVEQESDGTQAMLAFASIAIDALEAGDTLIIDELDGSLHPLLVRNLVKQFADPTTNPKQAQLIFTTHDVSLLLDSPLMQRPLCRDQIWFTEKDRDGAASLYSLADFSPRKGEDLLRRYLSGVYGGVAAPRPVRRPL